MLEACIACGGSPVGIIHFVYQAVSKNNWRKTLGEHPRCF